MNIKIITFFIIGTLSSNAYAAQTCHSEVIQDAPNSRYINNVNATITDQQTGLMWKQCSEGPTNSDCTIPDAVVFNWQQALQQAETVNATGGFAGFNDWRLPNIKELSSLVETQCYLPSINLTLFPGTPVARHWSSSLKSSSDGVFFADFDDGGVGFAGNNRESTYYIRLVRDL